MDSDDESEEVELRTKAALVATNEGDRLANKTKRRIIEERHRLESRERISLQRSAALTAAIKKWKHATLKLFLIVSVWGERREKDPVGLANALRTDFTERKNLRLCKRYASINGLYNSNYLPSGEDDRLHLDLPLKERDTVERCHSFWQWYQDVDQITLAEVAWQKKVDVWEDEKEVRPKETYEQIQNDEEYEKISEWAREHKRDVMGYDRDRLCMSIQFLDEWVDERREEALHDLRKAQTERKASQTTKRKRQKKETQIKEAEAMVDL